MTTQVENPTTEVDAVERLSVGGTLRQRIGPHLGEIASRAADTETARRVPGENIRLLREAGFFRSLVPADLGGDERDPVDFCDGVRAVSKACPSTGWVVGVMSGHPPFTFHFHPSVQDEIWANGPDTIICSSGMPYIKAKVVDGGIRVSGKGRWASGCAHAEYALVGVRVPDLADSEYPERNYRFQWFPAHRSQFEIEDTWYSTGMRGSGSADLVFDNHFVPLHKLEGMDAMQGGYGHGTGTVDSWITRVPFMTLSFLFFPAVALGCADGMIEQYIKRQTTRKHIATGTKGITNPAGHMRLAESVHEIESLTVYLDDVLSELRRRGHEGPRMTPDEQVEVVARLNFVIDRSVNVIDRLFEASGSSAIADFNPMQRYWRDGHTVRLHAATDYDQWLIHEGRTMLGLPPSADV